jgi:hypothetical protein
MASQIILVTCTVITVALFATRGGLVLFAIMARVYCLIPLQAFGKRVSRLYMQMP